jgi:hypothetical protein
MERNAIIDELLLKIKADPDLYLEERSVELLRFFIFGFDFCQATYNPGFTSFYYEFQGFIQEKYNVDTAQIWSRIIRFYSNSDSAAFDKFFELLDEFYMIIDEPEQ